MIALMFLYRMERVYFFRAAAQFAHTKNLFEFKLVPVCKLTWGFMALVAPPPGEDDVQRPFFLGGWRSVRLMLNIFGMH